MKPKNIHNVDAVISENIKRNALLDEPFNPYTGEGSLTDRQKVTFLDVENALYLPKSMYEVEWMQQLTETRSLSDFAKNFRVETEDVVIALSMERYKHDFEFWAATTIKITDKDKFKDVPFILRRAQRILLAELEKMRLAGAPIRIVLLKARQWGGSTLVQIYMMWIQQIHRENWHLAVCAQDVDAARNIRGMYSKAARLYPAELNTVTLRPYEGSEKNRYCIERGGIIGVGSVNNPDQFRSYNYAMAHLSEVGIWQDTLKKNAGDLISSLKETVPDVPYSVIVEESTAKGLNYFYDSWKSASSGNTRYKAVFIPFYKIDRDRVPLETTPVDFINSMSEYDWFLWSKGASLEAINWYNKHKADRYAQADASGEVFSDWRMQQENPAEPEEAFKSAGEKRFNPKYIAAMEKDCRPPEFIGTIRAKSTSGEDSLKNIEFYPEKTGRLYIWTMPDKSIKVVNRYAAYADIGGVWTGADRSVLKVVDRYWMLEGGDPETVAVWAGHIDKDLFGWLCAQICTMYNNALLAIESNSYDKDRSRDDHFLTVIEKISKHYSNLYIRNRPEKVGDDYVPIYGFHMNKATKPAVIDALYAASRERYNKDLGLQDNYCLIERDIRTIREMNWYEKKENGTLGAMEGQRDDHVDATAGVFYIATERMQPPQLVQETTYTPRRRMRTESSF